MLFGVISDTHGHTGFAQAAVGRLAALKVDEVIHCGDIGSPAIVRLLKPWPTHYVLGNCDHARDEPSLRSEIERVGHQLHGRFGELERCGRRIAFLHGDDADRLAAAIREGAYDLVCYGHTHVARCERRGITTALNPGALYRADPHLFAVVELPGMKITTEVV